MHRLSIPLLLVALCISCDHRHDKKSTGQQEPVLTVETAVAETLTIPQRMTFAGKLTSNYDIVVQPRVTAFLKRKIYSDGMPVRKGQLLFVIDGNDLSTTVAAAEASLFSAQAQEQEARSNYERAVPLARINAISQTQLDQYATQHSSAKASVRSAEQSLKRAKLNYGYTSIYSPADGIIADTPAHEGDLVGPESKFDKLTTISNIDSMKISIAIPTSQYLKFNDNRRKNSFSNEGLLSNIHLTLADGTGYPFEGRYDYTRKDISDAMGALQIVVIFPNPDYLLKPGQFARVTADIGESQPAVFVPERAVSQAQGVNSVWIVHNNGTAEYRQVELGGSLDGKWRIDKGLQEGEVVVLSGAQKLRNGMKVKTSGNK